MLEFFRKYQRYFFVFITIVIIASFSFFGTFTTFARDEKKADRLITRAVDGSPLMLSEIQALTRFISSDREDAAGHGVVPNLCNDGVVRYDLLRTGLADLLAGSYFEEIKHEFEPRLDRAKRFRPYAHPQMPMLNAESVWDQFFPAMKRELASLQGENEVSQTTFSHFSRLYQQQSYLTPESLRRILYFQHQHLGMKIDPALQYGDLSLFGFHSLTDWFGRDFLVLASEFILNAAAAAEQKGYAVTLDEAKGDLLSHFIVSMQKLHTDPTKPAVTFAQHLRNLGFDEASAAEVWRKVLLFRRYFQGVSQAAFVDRLPFKDFVSYARETANIGVYQWPESLRFKNIQDLIEFETYLSAVALPTDDLLELPSVFHPQEIVEEETPELVQASYKAKVKEISLAELALRAQVKEVWEWQLDEKNWDALKTEFSFLSQGCTKEERFQSLEKLSPSNRALVDSSVRLRLLEKHPEWKEDALEAAESSERTISISKASCSLPRVEKPWRLCGLMLRSANGDEEARSELSAYFDDGKTLYRIEEVEKIKEPRILTYSEAKSQGILARIAERTLSAAYPKIRSKSPSKFQTKEGSWKPFLEVKSEVAKAVFSDLFKSIEKTQTIEWTDELFAKCRFLAPTRKAYKDLQRNPEDPRWLPIEKSDLLEDQFKLVRTEMPIQRTSQEEWMKKNAFVMMPNEWSPIRVPPQGELSFFYLIDKKVHENPVLDQISFGKELIAADAQRYLAEKLLESIYGSQSIQLLKEDVQ